MCRLLRFAGCRGGRVSAFFFRLFRLGIAAFLERKHSLSRLYLVSRFDVDLFDDPFDARRHFERGFVSLEFHHRLVLFDVIAWLDEHLQDIALRDAIAEVRKVEFGQGNLTSGRRVRRPYRIGATTSPLADCLRDRRINFLGINLEIFDRLRDEVGLHLLVLQQLVERRNSNEARVDFEEVA
jgi:hypothetical protein